MKQYTTKQADIMMFFVAFIWGSGFVVTKSALDSLSAIQIMSFRFITASVVSLVFFRKRIKKINRQYLRGGLVMGLFLATGFLFQTLGIQFTTAANNAFITSTGVVMVPFVYWITLRKRPKTHNLIAAFTMLFGITLLTVDFDHLGKFNQGDFLTLLGAIFFACHIVATLHYVDDKDPVVLSTVQIVVCAVFFAVAMFFDADVRLVTPGSLWGAVYLGLFSTFLCFSLQTTAQKFTGATHAAIILSLEAVFGSVLAVLLLKEGYNIMMIVGFVIIFLSVLMAELGENWIGRGSVND